MFLFLTVLLVFWENHNLSNCHTFLFYLSFNPQAQAWAELKITIYLMQQNIFLFWFPIFQFLWLWVMSSQFPSVNPSHCRSASRQDLDTEISGWKKKKLLLSSSMIVNHFISFNFVKLNLCQYFLLIWNCTFTLLHGTAAQQTWTRMNLDYKINM